MDNNDKEYFDEDNLSEEGTIQTKKSTSLSERFSDFGNWIGDIFGWVIGIGIAFCIGYILFGLLFGDLRFSLPQTPPVTERYAETNETKIFNIIYNEYFQGSAEYYIADKEILFYIVNNSKKTIDLADAKFWAWTFDGKGYRLAFQSSFNSSYRNNLLLYLNPGESIGIRCESPSSIPEYENIKGFSISKINGIDDNLRFGYHKLSLWDRARWIIAEQLRKNK